MKTPDEDIIPTPDEVEPEYNEPDETEDTVDEELEYVEELAADELPDDGEDELPEQLTVPEGYELPDHEEAGE